MKLYKLLGIMLLSTGMILFTGCTSGEEGTDDQDTGVEVTDTGNDDVTDTGANEDGSDTGEAEGDTSVDSDTGIDDRTEIEIFCDTVCEYIVDCAEAEGIAEEGDLEECIAECIADTNDEVEEDAACAETMMDAFVCFTGLSCEEANSLFGGENELTEEHTCYNAWTTWDSTCNPLATAEEISTACEEICTIMNTPCEATEEAEGDVGVEDPTEGIEKCTEECEMTFISLATHSTDCSDSLFDFSSCIAELTCEAATGEEPQCEEEEDELFEICNPEAVFANMCQDTCDHLVACEVGMENCMEGCAFTYYEIYATGDDECADAFGNWAACIATAECVDLEGFEGPSTEGVCGTEFGATMDVCELD